MGDRSARGGIARFRATAEQSCPFSPGISLVSSIFASQSKLDLLIKNRSAACRKGLQQLKDEVKDLELESRQVRTNFCNHNFSFYGELTLYNVESNAVFSVYLSAMKGDSNCAPRMCGGDVAQVTYQVRVSRKYVFPRPRMWELFIA